MFKETFSRQTTIHECNWIWNFSQLTSKNQLQNGFKRTLSRTNFQTANGSEPSSFFCDTTTPTTTPTQSPKNSPFGQSPKDPAPRVLSRDSGRGRSPQLIHKSKVTSQIKPNVDILKHRPAHPFLRQLFGWWSKAMLGSALNWISNLALHQVSRQASVAMAPPQSDETQPSRTGHFWNTHQSDFSKEDLVAPPTLTSQADLSRNSSRQFHNNCINSTPVSSRLIKTLLSTSKFPNALFVSSSANVFSSLGLHLKPSNKLFRNKCSAICILTKASGHFVVDAFNIKASFALLSVPALRTTGTGSYPASFPRYPKALRPTIVASSSAGDCPSDLNKHGISPRVTSKANHLPVDISCPPKTTKFTSHFASVRNLLCCSFFSLLHVYLKSCRSSCLPMKCSTSLTNLL